MEFKHTSVLYEPTIEKLNIKEDGVYVDGTLGGGGHASGICQKLGEAGTLIGIDRDKDALKAAENRLKEYKCHKVLVQSNYADVLTVLDDLNIDGIDGAVLDLGVSSFQLDNKDRGFSYMQDAPLDMRMNTDDVLTAYEVVNNYQEEELFRIIKEYGEERWAKKIASKIVKHRENFPINTTFELVDIIKGAIPASARRDGPHPAKRTFQAIRIEVNQELALLEKAVRDFCKALKPSGRLAIITFHSLEDRIVKDVFKELANPCICPPKMPVCTCGKVPEIKIINKKPVVAGEEELLENPRSRSAKLRVCQKI